MVIYEIFRPLAKNFKQRPDLFRFLFLVYHEILCGIEAGIRI